ncbi:MAG: type II secretion system protein [Lentisphaerota bacterium]
MSCPNHRSRGFTLFELVLVIMIIMIASAVAIPYFVRSARATKLRTSVRTVVMAHRHARNTAVLGQQQVAILFDTLKNEVEIVAVGADSNREKEGQFLDERDQRTTAALDEEGKPSAEEGAALPAINSMIIRPLADDVNIAGFKCEKKNQEHDGIYWVNYYPNGMCDKYSLELHDKYNKVVSIKVDPLSGKVDMEYE